MRLHTKLWHSRTHRLDRGLRAPGNRSVESRPLHSVRSWKSDYAIVAKLDDSTTGVPVLIETGLVNDGILAASELITTGALARQLNAEASCSRKANFEAVIETNIIDTRPGPPRILRVNCW